MKRVNGLTETPPGLARFHADDGVVDKAWDALGSFEAGEARRELTHTLVERQHGLCAYCEIDLIPHDRRVEHFIPQSDPDQGLALACDPANLLAVCMGGSNAAGFGPKTRVSDQARFLPPSHRNLSCDAAKQDRPAAAFLDPRQIPAAPSLLRVTMTGHLESDPDNCAAHGLPHARVEAHIQGLGLNVGRLRNSREAVWLALTEAYQAFSILPPEEREAGLRLLAEDQLLPNAEGRLKRFFTTTRSFFGTLAEEILERPPQLWI